MNTCIHCGGTMRIVASIEDPAVIRAILGNFEKHGAMEEAHYRPPARSARCGRVQHDHSQGASSLGRPAK
ncbi:MAG: hypothetical protein M3Q42_02290 [Pseudomonadota bacterium]|nr:hypothetical protein [Pseudomonadota bacterium]